MPLRLCSSLVLSEVSRVGGIDRMTVVSLDDLLNKPMAHDIPFIEIDELNAGDVLKNVAHFNEAGHTIGRQVDLRNVPRHHGLRVKSQASEEHFHLLGGRILSFVQNHE